MNLCEEMLGQTPCIQWLQKTNKKIKVLTWTIEPKNQNTYQSSLIRVDELSLDSQVNSTMYADRTYLHSFPFRYETNGDYSAFSGKKVMISVEKEPSLKISDNIGLGFVGKGYLSDVDSNSQAAYLVNNYYLSRPLYVYMVNVAGPNRQLNYDDRLVLHFQKSSVDIYRQGKKTCDEHPMKGTVVQLGMSLIAIRPWNPTPPFDYPIVLRWIYDSGTLRAQVMSGEEYPDYNGYTVVDVPETKQAFGCKAWSEIINTQ